MNRSLHVHFLAPRLDFLAHAAWLADRGYIGAGFGAVWEELWLYNNHRSAQKSTVKCMVEKTRATSIN